MATLILAIVLVTLAMLGLGLGVVLGRAPLKGSCGGSVCTRAISCAGCRAATRMEDTE